MFSKTTLFATLLGFLSLFFLGYLFYDVLAGEYFESHRTTALNEMMDFKYITLGTLIEAYVLAVLYGKWATGKLREKFWLSLWGLDRCFCWFWHWPSHVWHLPNARP